ncbi:MULTISPECIES: peptidoglycan editing factor PgeF [unclassified Moraxella]|uniref:peptidoglycan editing factor PgeF n=1 Tax=unclassified Moraxella TaxID=2685852 RepID=UPI003AF887A9
MSYLVLHKDANVLVVQTTVGESPVSATQPYGGYNLGLHVGDHAESVYQHRADLLVQLQQASHPSTSDTRNIKRIDWLTQVHGNQVYHVTEQLHTHPISADAHITTLPSVALAIMTADCVPVMIATENGEVIGAVHAGWQGLAKNVIANTIQKMAHQIDIQNQDLTATELYKVTQNWQAWVGACIASQNYEVDNRVKDAILSVLNVTEAQANLLFKPSEKTGHYYADLAKVAELQLNACGIANVMQSGLDSYADERFYSYRKQTQDNLPNTGRMATLIIKKG